MDFACYGWIKFASETFLFFILMKIFLVENHIILSNNLI